MTVTTQALANAGSGGQQVWVVAPGINPLAPAGAIAATWPRFLQSADFAVLASQRLTLFAIWVPTATVITTISIVSGTTGAGAPTNQWFGLFDQSRTKLRLTSDDTNVAWPANTVKTLTLSAPFTTTYQGLHYIGVLVRAIVVPSLQGAALSAPNSVAAQIAPPTAGNCDTGLTTPATCPATANNFSAGFVANLAYAFIS